MHISTFAMREIREWICPYPVMVLHIFCTYIALLVRSKAHLSLEQMEDAGKYCAAGLRLDPGNLY